MSEIAPAAFCASIASWLKHQFGSGPQRAQGIIEGLANLPPDISHMAAFIHEVQKTFVS
jgi:hypothetical protein